MDWLNKNLRSDIKIIFEPRYKRKIADYEVEKIAENLTNVIEQILKFKWKNKYGNTD